MEVRAISKSVRVSPRKMRLVADAIRNLPIEEAYRVLHVTEQKAADSIQKTLKSAVANAVTNAKLEIKNLYISTVMVNQGQVLKRFRPSTRGRIHPYKKRGSHLTIILKEKVVMNAATVGAQAATVSNKADEAVAAAIYGGKEEKKTGGKSLVQRLTGRGDKKEKKEVKKSV